MKAENSNAIGSKKSVGVSPPYDVMVLRLGHRLVRDARMSTHVGLVARAFGARSLVISGADDETVDSLRRVAESWGGNFVVSFTKSWRETIRKQEGVVVHLTMYGEQLGDCIGRIREDLNERASSSGRTPQVLIVIGAEKVPSEVFQIATYNVAVGNQPHSEVAALAVFLDRLFMGEELYYRFDKAKLRIVPKAKGKQVERGAFSL